MRSSICAQSCASVPPAPAWMSRKALCESISPREHALELEVTHLALQALRVALDVARRRFVVFRFGQLEQLRGVRHPLVVRSISPTSALRRARSRPSSCARAGLDHTAGSSSSRATSSSRSCLRSYSKKPPERGETLAEIFELTLELIDFHGISARASGDAGAHRSA